jgi:hypothetical protein
MISNENLVNYKVVDLVDIYNLKNGFLCMVSTYRMKDIYSCGWEHQQPIRFNL